MHFSLCCKNQLRFAFPPITDQFSLMSMLVQLTMYGHGNISLHTPPARSLFYASTHVQLLVITTLWNLWCLLHAARLLICIIELLGIVFT